jgi:hypothetical protein
LRELVCTYTQLLEMSRFVERLKINCSSQTCRRKRYTQSACVETSRHTQSQHTTSSGALGTGNDGVITQHMCGGSTGAAPLPSQALALSLPLSHRIACVLLKGCGLLGRDVCLAIGDLVLVGNGGPGVAGAVRVRVKPARLLDAHNQLVPDTVDKQPKLDCSPVACQHRRRSAAPHRSEVSTWRGRCPRNVCPRGGCWRLRTQHKGVSASENNQSS